MKVPKHILIAEDEKFQRLKLRKACTTAFPTTRISTASNSLEAIQTASAENIDFCLLDFNLGDGTAKDLIPKLSIAIPDCPMIVTSASDTQDVVIESIRAGSADFIKKSDAFKPQKLANQVSDVLERIWLSQQERRKLDRRLQKIRSTASTDPLTGLLNRRGVDERLNGADRRTIDRRAQTAAICIDIDHFKQVNDRHGHKAGDVALGIVSRLLRRRALNRDILARWGGEEFLVIKPSTTYAEALLWCERLRRELSDTPISVDDESFFITASFGICCVPSTEFNASIFDRADRALYRAKELGRNRCSTWAFSNFLDFVKPGELSSLQAIEDVLSRYEKSLSDTQQEHLAPHSRAVGELADHIAKLLTLDDEARQRIKVAGRLHDIGKVAVPESVLAKPRSLTAAEYYAVMRHVRDGSDIAAERCDLPEVASLIEQHHDRFDQHGVRWLQEASVLPVADAICTMQTDRPYQQRRTNDEIVEEIVTEAGMQFSPAAVIAAVRAMDAC